MTAHCFLRALQCQSSYAANRPAQNHAATPIQVSITSGFTHALPGWTAILFALLTTIAAASRESVRLSSLELQGLDARSLQVGREHFQIDARWNLSLERHASQFAAAIAPALSEPQSEASGEGAGR